MLHGHDFFPNEFSFMTTIAVPNAKAKDAFALKGGVFTLTTLVLHTLDLGSIEKLLIEKVNIAPKFFYYAPIVVDCTPLDQSKGIDFKGILELLRKHQLIPIGIRGVNADLHPQAIEHSLAIMPESRHAREKNIHVTNSDEPTESTPKIRQPVPVEASQILAGSPTKLISQPVRSGQQIYAPGGDLLVIAPVSPGAELLADGNIFVFGPLRGRALAGITGDQNAMIFCKSLEAELVSIAGQYKISEDLKETCWKQSARIHLVDEHLQFSDF